ncbi:MAG: S8 family serine peptidase [Pseudomonadota bacterium]
MRTVTRILHRTWTGLLLLLTSFVLFGCQSAVLKPPSGAAIRADRDDVVDPAQIVVLADNRIASENLRIKAQALGYEHQRTDDLAALGLFQSVFIIPAGRTGAAAIAELEGLQGGVTAGVNHAYRPQRAEAGRRYARALMAWSDERCPLTNALGVIDGHFGEMAPSIELGYFSGQKTDRVGHGADIVALIASVAEIGPSTLFLADVFLRANGEDVASVDGILRAVAWMVENDVRVVNISLAGPYNKILDRGLQRAHDRGALMIAAVGNDGASAPPRYPAAFTDVIAVTAIDAEEQLYARAVRGQHVDIAAPGVDIFISSEGGRYQSGTSFASPFVSLFFALRSDDQLSADQARGVLSSHSRDIGAVGWDREFGAGALQANLSCN